MTPLKKSLDKRDSFYIVVSSSLLLVLLVSLFITRSVGWLEISVFAAIAATLGAFLFGKLNKSPDVNKLVEDKTYIKVSAIKQETNPPPFAELKTANKQPTRNLQDLDVIIVSWDMSLVAQICRHLDAWKKRYIVCSDGDQAISFLTQINCAQDSLRSCSLIVDGRNKDTERLSVFIGNESKLAGMLYLYLYDPISETESQAVLRQGYDGSISAQEVIPQLFAYLQSDDLPTHADNIISFSGYRNDLNQQRNSKSILLAEQDVSDRKQIQDSLRNAGHKVITVADGDQALEALEHQSFDLAIINLELPIMNGTQVVRLHRFTTAYKKQVPFIVITSNNTPNSLRICRDLHIQTCLFKPVSGTELLDQIDECLSSVDILNKRTSELHSEIEKESSQHYRLGLLDTNILDALEKRNDEQRYIKDMISAFEDESASILYDMQKSLKNMEIDRFHSLCNAMMDNASQLGALTLQKMSANTQHINQQNFLIEGERLMYHLEKTCLATSRALQQYLKEKNAHQAHKI